jgi:hypothetical protein
MNCCRAEWSPVYFAPTVSNYRDLATLVIAVERNALLAAPAKLDRQEIAEPSPPKFHDDPDILLNADRARGANWIRLVRSGRARCRDNAAGTPGCN